MVNATQPARTRTAAPAVRAQAAPKRSFAEAAGGGRRQNFAGIASPNRFTEAHFAHASRADAAGNLRPHLQDLRVRVRYECDTNAYARGMVETHANDVVCDGPSLQMTTPDQAFNAFMEAEFTEWAENYCDAEGQLDLAGILRVVDAAQLHTGAILIALQHDAAAETAITLRLKLIEADRLATPIGMTGDPNVRDGIRFDAKGRPTHYYILKRHPGDTSPFGGFGAMDYDTLSARDVIHVFKPDRPGATTAPPWLTAALLPLADLADYTTSVLRAARRAAGIAGTWETNLDDVETDQDIETMEPVDMPDDSSLVAPLGWTFKEHKAEQPTATHAAFKADVLAQIGRPVQMPYNVVAGTSKGSNFASGKLDWGLYFRHVRTVRKTYARAILNRCLREAAADLRFDKRTRPAWRRLMGDGLTGAWAWPGHDPVDPVKEASAETLNAAGLRDTLADAWARRGEDWETKLRQIAKEKAFIAALEKEFRVKLDLADVIPAKTILASALIDEPGGVAADAGDTAP